MSEIFALLRIGGALTITGLAGLALQAVAIVLAARCARARKRGESKGALLPILLAVAALLALLLVCHLMVQARWETITEAAEGADPAKRTVLLQVGRRLGIMDIYHLGAWFLLLQTLLGAVAVGIALASRARSSEGGRRGAGTYLAVSLMVGLLPVGPLCVGVLRFVLGWQRIFASITGADPHGRCMMLVTGAAEPRTALAMGATAAAIGLGLSCTLVSWLALRRSRRAVRGVLAFVAIVGCLGAAAWLWISSRRYVLPAPDGPVQRYLAAAGLPGDLVDRLRKDPEIAGDLHANLTIGDDLWPPESTSIVRCEQMIRVTVTCGAVLVEGDLVVSVKRGAVDAAVKRDGASGYLIEPLAAELGRHATRLRKIEKMTGGRMRFSGTFELVADGRTPFRLVAEVLHSAARAGFVRHQIVTLAARKPFKRRLALRCIEARTPSYTEQRPAEHPVGLNLAVAVTYRGFIVGGAGELMRGPDGSLPTIQCAKNLEEGRCPVWMDPKTHSWTDGHDHEGLARLAASVKRKHPGERSVIVSADRAIPLQTVIRTLDALRGKCADEGCLFDRPVLSPGVQ